MTNLITGATGFIGSHMLRSGDRALVRRPAGLPNEVLGDLLDPASLAVACSGIDTIFHCAGHAHAFASSQTDLHWQVNYDGTRNLINAAARAGVKKFIFLSSVKAMGEPGEDCIDEQCSRQPMTAYGQAKRQAEEVVLEAGRQFGMHVVNLRLAMVYGKGGRGNLERMAHAIRQGWFPPLPDSGNRRSLVHVKDVVSAAYCAAMAPAAAGRTYIVAHPTQHSGHDLYAAIRQALELPEMFLSIPAWVLRGAGQLGDLASALRGRRLPLNTEVVTRLLESECYLSDAITRELGWQAVIDLRSGLREMLGHETSV